ncbi:FkbM family methyltransferase [Propionivibrio limicola]|uniref:FkbM family methyltransferase n=1 Tax=Propionivibrio limicola TaxID=167645 RepID=UPI0012923B97|nr:FkbM family methyltransferase [Propionivibrio limicola]
MRFISYAQNYEDVMLWRALGYVGAGFYIDVGANTPEGDSVTKAFYDRGWHGINIEPLAEHHAELEAARPRDLNLQVAIGDSEGQATLYAPDIRGWATVSTEVAQRHDQQGVPMRTTTVPVQRLDRICEQYAPPDIHFLKIDVEGYEAQVLAGMDFSRFRPWIVVVEAINPQQNNQNSTAWDAPLLDNRYRPVYFDGLNRFYLAEEHSALAQAFQLPPNVFDDFVRLETVHAQQALAATERRLSEIQAQNDAALRAMHAEAASMQARLDATQSELGRTQSELDGTRSELERTQAELERTRSELGKKQSELNTIIGSRSWKLTRPLRYALRYARRIKACLQSPSTPTPPECRPSAEQAADTEAQQATPLPAATNQTAEVATPALTQEPMPQRPAPQPSDLKIPGTSILSALEPPETNRLATHGAPPSMLPMWYRLTGHAEGHYSLAVVNRGILGALAHAHPDHVSLQPRDGDCTTLSANAPAWLARLAGQAIPADAEALVHTCSIVHHYPPISDPQPAKWRLALFFWEETHVPAHIVEHFETHFDAVLTASQFVKRALRNSGFSKPIVVIPMGVDHLASNPGAPLAPLPRADRCRFLHVSSVFPRKGPDVLLNAWLRQFTADDAVELYIKTFPNPHNDIRRQWDELSAGHPNPPHITIDETPLDADQMRALYQSAHALVLPTRGEGFNLPAAEALALGLPVLVTGHGAHTDYCNQQTATLIPFRFAPSASHLRTHESCWIEPDAESLGRQLKELHQEILTNAPALERRRQAAHAHLWANYTWQRSAEGIARTLALLNEPSAPTPIALHLVSPWNTACGIAEYARDLVSACDDATFTLRIACDRRTTESGADGNRHYAPTWTLGDTDSVRQTLENIGQHSNPGDIVLIQHQPSLFRLETAVCEQMQTLAQRGMAVILEIHATRPLLDHQRPPQPAIDALRRIDRIIVHSIEDLNHLLALGLDNNLLLLPHGVAPHAPSRTVSRSALGLPENALVVATFGFLHPHKGIDRLIASLPLISAQTGQETHLLAITALPDPERTELLRQYQTQASELGLADRLHWHTDYQEIGQSIAQLACADYILFPYGQTQESASGAVTIGLTTGKPVIVSDQPIFADLAAITWQTARNSAAAIADAVATLHRTPALIEQLQTAQNQWLDERSWPRTSARLARTLIGCSRDKALHQHDAPRVAPTPPRHRLLVDISELYARDARTGIQRVVRNILQQLQQHRLPHLAGYQILPVYGVPGQGFCHTRRFDPAAPLPASFPEALPAENAVVEPEAGDIFLGLDLSAHLFPEAEEWLNSYRRHGVRVYYVIYDIIPLRHPEWTIPGMPEAFDRWLRAIARQSTRLLCISNTVANDVRDWLLSHASEEVIPDITHFPLGADILAETTVGAAAKPAAPTALPAWSKAPGTPIFLSVSTIEPRKGQMQILAAFETLWAEGHDATLILVGKAGWMMDEFIERLEKHPENGHHLFWLQGISDSELELIYSRASALIAASEDEGYGLPLIEAARHHLPIIARNIPVFREVAGPHAFYFTGHTARHLAESVKFWQELQRHGQHPSPEGLQWHSWQQAAQQLQNCLMPVHLDQPDLY